jgi:osmotically-inducible protein OsmY
MCGVKPLYAMAFVFIMTGALPGCATYDKCGFNGCPSDAKITANVQTRFDRHSELGSPNSINVQTVNHVVYLSGLVSAGEESQTAESIAQQTSGVAQVVNTIAVSH